MSFFNAGQDPATDALKDYYANPGANAWTDVSQDGGTTDLTCSFVPNKTLVDQGRSTKVPSEANPFVLNELQRWATTTGFFTFTEVTDAGGQFNDVGAPQADPDAGDIRATL